MPFFPIVNSSLLCIVFSYVKQAQRLAVSRSSRVVNWNKERSDWQSHTLCCSHVQHAQRPTARRTSCDVDCPSPDIMWYRLSVVHHVMYCINKLYTYKTSAATCSYWDWQQYKSLKTTRNKKEKQWMITFLLVSINNLCLPSIAKTCLKP